MKQVCVGTANYFKSQIQHHYIKLHKQYNVLQDKAVCSN